MMVVTPRNGYYTVDLDDKIFMVSDADWHAYWHEQRAQMVAGYEHELRGYAENTIADIRRDLPNLDEIGLQVRLARIHNELLDLICQQCQEDRCALELHKKLVI